MISTQWRAITSLAIVFSLFTPALPSIATPSLPSALQTVGDSNQVVLVQAPDWKSTKGTLRAFERANGRWTEVVPEVSADLGYGGLVPGQQRVLVGKLTLERSWITFGLIAMMPGHTTLSFQKPTMYFKVPIAVGPITGNMLSDFIPTVSSTTMLQSWTTTFHQGK
jgi:hypothetical protein